MGRSFVDARDWSFARLQNDAEHGWRTKDPVSFISAAVQLSVRDQLAREEITFHSPDSGVLVDRTVSPRRSPYEFLDRIRSG
jgi:hypothetical protein